MTRGVRSIGAARRERRRRERLEQGEQHLTIGQRLGVLAGVGLVVAGIAVAAKTLERVL